MEDRQCRVRLPACCVGMLVFSLWLQTFVSGTVLRADRADDSTRNKAMSPPCFGERCKIVHKSNQNNDELHYSDVLNRLLRGPRRRRTPRAKRQTVVVEVDDLGTGSSHRVACTPAERRKTACLNGGKCYALDMGHLRDASCHCPAKYEGPRCELLSTYYFLTYYSQLKKGAIIGGLVIGIILIIVAVSVYCSYRKGRRKRDQPLCCCRKRSPSSAAKPREAEGVSDPMMPDTTTDIEVSNANGVNGMKDTKV